MERQKWEYCTLVYDDGRGEILRRIGERREVLEGIFQAHFNVLGEEGWELCAYFPPREGASYCVNETATFKRPVADA